MCVFFYLRLSCVILLSWFFSIVFFSFAFHMENNVQLDVFKKSDIIGYWKVSRVSMYSSYITLRNGVSSEAENSFDIHRRKRDILNAHVKFINKSTVWWESNFRNFPLQQYIAKKGVWLENLLFSRVSQQHKFSTTASYPYPSGRWLYITFFSVSDTYSWVTNTSIHATWSTLTFK